LVVSQPTGTVTLLFTDVEGSTFLLERLGVELYAEALEVHRRVLREAFARHGGYEVDEEGDAFLVAFPAAGAAVACADESQRGLASVVWPHEGGLRVRMGVHTGEPLPVPPKYVGMDVHRAARIMAAGHGGQVLVSETTAALLDGAPLRDLGPHRLKDMLQPIRLYQLEVGGLPTEFPPLRSLHQTNLPVAAWPLLGRERELEEIRELVAADARLVTLTGTGGSGKTRLALQAAAELSDEFRDGVFFVGLAPLRETEAVRSAVVEAVGLQAADDVVAWLGSRRVLLVLDNLEHLHAVEAVVSELLVGEVVVLATSRAPLHLSAERELPVDPLVSEAAVELFVSRAAAVGRKVESDATVAEVCRRLDNLPLALELAAARAKLLSPAALLQRLDTALPLLSGGAHDTPKRQQTLRATIEWSHELLDVHAKAAFRRLSVFRGSFTLDAAESVAQADLDRVSGLVDQSLVKPLGEDRFFLLETIREYASERLDQAGEEPDYLLRHARHYLAQLEARAALPAGQRLAWFAPEEDNLRAMLDELTAREPSEAARAAKLLGWYWRSRGAHLEERQRVDALLATDGLPESTRPRLLLSLASTVLRLGDAAGAELAASDALATAEPRSEDHVFALLVTATVSLQHGETARSVRLATEAAELGREHDDQHRLSALIDAGVTLADAGQPEKAREMWTEAREGFVQTGSELGAAVARWRVDGAPPIGVLLHEASSGQNIPPRRAPLLTGPVRSHGSPATKTDVCEVEEGGWRSDAAPRRGGRGRRGLQRVLLRTRCSKEECGRVEETHQDAP
jgi:predicted ATPase/class 3 adenylate cyclase